MPVATRNVSGGAAGRHQTAATATPHTTESYIAAHGSRDPAVSSSPKEFTLAIVVLSYGRLLSESELAFFDAVAGRAESACSAPEILGPPDCSSSGVEHWGSTRIASFQSQA